MNRQLPRMLIIDDDELAADVFSRLFALRGWEAIKTHSVAEAVASLDIVFDLAILDLMLPDGSGTEFLEALRARGIATPVIIFTATDAGDLKLDEVNAFRPRQVFHKPGDFSKLEASVQDIRDAFVPLKPSGAP